MIDTINQVQKILLKTTRKGFAQRYLEIACLSEKDALDQYVEEKRSALLLHAYEHNSYYHRIFTQIDLIQDGKVDPARISDIPVLTKEIIRKNQQDLISDDYQSRKWFYNASGGSTGDPIRLIQDDYFSKWRDVTNYYYYKNILGIDEPMVKKVLLWGSDRDIFKGSVGLRAKISNRLTNTVFLNSYRMTEKNIEEYIKTINSFKPEIVRGYAGSLFELCRYAESNKIPLYTPKIVVSTAESLSKMMRDTIESNFGTKVYNFYGSREVSNLAGECNDGLMHPFMFWNYQEILDSHNQPVREGEEGRVVVTNLFNYSMPLIRYEIGDMAIRGPGKCSCECILPTFQDITGRISDHFILENGTRVTGRFFSGLLSIYCVNDNIEKFQVIQEDYLKVRIQAVTKGEITEHYRRQVNEKILLVMGPNCQIKWEFVDDIPKTPSGKYLYTKSLVWR